MLPKSSQKQLSARIRGYLDPLRENRVPHCLTAPLKGFGRPSSSLIAQLVKNPPATTPGSGRSAGEGIGYPLQYSWASFVAQLVKNLPASRETWIQSLGWEDPLKKGKATNYALGLSFWNAPS